jgi:hypothetical protein
MALAMMLAGCLDTSDPKADYIEKADEACRPSAEREAKLRAEIQAARSASDSERALTAARALNRSGTQQVAALRKVEPPAEDKPKINRLINLSTQARTALADAIEAIDRGDVSQQAASVRESRDKGARAARLAHKYGFRTCLTGRT